VVDLACMRDAMNRLGSDSNKINSLVHVLTIFPCAIIEVTAIGHSDIIFGLQFSYFGLAAYACMLTSNKDFSWFCILY
jgi:hypothetical protein